MFCRSVKVKVWIQSRFTIIGASIAVLAGFPALSLPQDLPPVPKTISRAILELQGKPYLLEIEPGKDARVRKGGLYCANIYQTPELECKNCSLVLKLGQKELSRMSLGEYGFVYDNGSWHVTGGPPINVLKKPGDFPLIVLSQYAGCNGNTYAFYWIDEKSGLTLKPVTFTGSPTRGEDNRLYAGMHFESDIRFVETSRYYQRELWVGGYDNAYAGAFNVQFGETAPGQWSCIGFYSQAGGSMPEVQKRLLGK
jgi:hypothetical protein